MSDPQSTDIADVPAEVKAAVVAARQPDSDSGTHFYRVFRLPAGAVATDDPQHESHRWNKAETLRDAARRGLHPTADDATVESVEVLDDWSLKVTYAVPVDPTGSATEVVFPEATVNTSEPAQEPPAETDPTGEQSTP